MPRTLVVPLVVGACGCASFVSGTVLFFVGLSVADAGDGDGSAAFPLALIGVGTVLFIASLMTSGPLFSARKMERD